MTFLALVTRLCEETGVPTDQLTDVATATGQLKQMVNWTASAWTHIQSLKQTWRFMRRTASWVSINNQASYTLAQCGLTGGIHKTWIKDSFRCHVTATGVGSQIFLPYRQYDRFRDRWLFNANQNVTGMPVELSIGPLQEIYLAPKPNGAIYTLTGDYYRSPVTLAVNADEPALPDGHDAMIIVHRARMSYGAHWGAKEQYADGQREYRALLRKLLVDQLDMPEMGGAIA